MSRLRPIASTPQPVAAVIICDGLKGPHIGITYRCAKKKAQRAIHLAFHHQLVDEPAVASALLRAPMIVEPAIDVEDLKILARFCTKRAHCQAQDIPYGFRYVGSTFAPEDGRFVAGKLEVGLTCSTFVLAMCDWAKIALVAAGTWVARAADAQFHEKMIDLLSRKNADLEHVAAVRKEASCVRFRAEEVAACSTFPKRPVTFVDAEPAGVKLADAFYAATGGQ